VRAPAVGLLEIVAIDLVNRRVLATVRAGSPRRAFAKPGLRIALGPAIAAAMA
jgi:hypothetical protein